MKTYNYKEYKEIKNTYKKYIAENQKKFKNNIMNMSFEELKESYYIKDLTKAQKQKSEKEIRNFIIEKNIKENSKRLEKFFKQCDEIAKAKNPKNIIISVSWAKSKTWGANPHAEVWASGFYTIGSASGCGYDKLSTAIAIAFNKNNSILKLIYTNYEKALRKNKSVSIRESVGYGLGYITPSFDGGVGYSCFRNFFHNIGAKVNTWTEGKNWDSMTIEF